METFHCYSFTLHSSKSKKAIWDCAGDRAPDPDGFNFSFVKRCCAALILKAKDPVHLSDFRPISLIGVINKVISKVLANRLKGLIGKLISEEQSAFLAGRSISDDPLILNELMGWIKNAKRKEVEELDYGNLVFGEGIRLSEWVAYIGVECTRGLRQGDPLSPFLFVIAMEALMGIMKRVVSIGLFNGLRCSNDGLYLSHFTYADDVMFIGEWAVSNVVNLRRILRCLYLTSLKVNLAKCSVYGIGVSDNEVQNMTGLLGCKKGSFPLKHLGLLVGVNMNLVKNWKLVMDIFRSRLSLWKVLEDLERCRRVFFWCGSEENAKMNWVAWDMTIALVEYGGLGFGSLKDANLAMLARWWWHFKSERGGLWRRVIWAIHHNSRSWTIILAKVIVTGPWKQIISVQNQL
ncbi:uncharacterized protein LOC118492153 [Helianthus annuus]|uniref:uncharacterized protein LOC118492153 n=1 Tax=Helianthus annuus TaxID=4232 RepID=UPI001652FCC0|nr:uncharacterized protein LOC118492153 [Helianthus annuus]